VTSGCIPMADRAGQRNIYYDVPNEHWLSHGAAYLTRAFGQSDLITKEAREASKGGDAFARIGKQLGLVVKGGSSALRRDIMAL
jgi:hypothetical protein